MEHEKLDVQMPKAEQGYTEEQEEVCTQLCTEEQLRAMLEKNSKEAEKLLEDEDKMEQFLLRLEEKLQKFPVLGGALASVPVLISLVRAYVRKEYPNIPLGTIIAIISALLYFLSPVDLIPDVIPGLGYIDDAAMIGFVLLMVHEDVEEYKRWRETKQKNDAIPL